jgi:hypothetical protein
MARRLKYDWEGVERFYIANVLSLREIGTLFGVDESNIRQRAKQYNWTRDLTEKIQQETASILLRDNGAEVEAEIVGQMAEMQAAIIRKHRGRAQKLQDLTERLTEELQDQTLNTDDYAAIAECAPDKMGYTIRKVTGSPQRIDSLKKLTDATKTLNDIEAKAWNISDNSNGNAPSAPKAPAVMAAAQALAADNYLADMIARINQREVPNGATEE